MEERQDLISRQAAIDAIVAWAKDHNEMPDGDDCIMIIGDLPSAQPEIIRCKDCVCSHDEVWLFGNGGATAYGYCGRTYLQVLPNDFCSKAERRTNNANVIT